MLYEEVLKRLNEDDVRYLVVGGVALVLHGVVRLTADLDLMIDLGGKNVIKFLGVMGELGYKPKAPVKAADFAEPAKRKTWMREKNMKVFSFFNPNRPLCIIDVFLDNPIDFGSAYSSRATADAGGITIPLASIDDLQRLKKLSGRTQDLADIESLEELKLFLKDERSKR